LEILEHKNELANDWAWQKGIAKEKRTFSIVQANPRLVVPNIGQMQYRAWAVAFASALMGKSAAFWYDQYLAKPPRFGSETMWHQDEGYWGRALYDRGLTCWMPFQEVDERNGCMSFIDGGHLDGILPHSRPASSQSDLLYCTPDVSRAIACPIDRGDVTFHHGKTPHMTTGNTSTRWRHAITTHLSTDGVTHGGDYYPWYVSVDQKSGKERAGAELEQHSKLKAASLSE
jgi:ectoine hydroxylase-related dioxygenase (phytanoyl-CoA dioxygenase family)